MQYTALIATLFVDDARELGNASLRALLQANATLEDWHRLLFRRYCVNSKSGKLGRLLSVALLLALVATSLLPVQPVAAAQIASPEEITQFVAGMTLSGTASYNTSGSATCVTNGTTWVPGDDACGSDNIIRTHDYAKYRVGFTLTPQDSNALISLSIGAFTLPASYTGPALTQVAHFDVADLPTGSNGCQNISTTPVSNPPPAGVSGVTADGQKLFCYQPSPISGNNLDFRVQINGDAPNGATVGAPTVTFQSANNAANSSPTALNGVVGSETFYGMPDLVISAAPRWDLWKNFITGQNVVFLPGSGPAGEDGYVFPWSLGILAHGSRKGLEALQSPFTITDTFNDPDFPNAQFIDWPLIIPGFANTDLTGTGHCQGWKAIGRRLGNTFDNTFYMVNDYEGVAPPYNASNAAYTVAEGGDCNTAAWDDVLKTATFSVTETDFTLQHYPVRRGYNAAGAVLVNPTNLDAASNEWWVANKWFMLWAPVTDVTTNTTEFLTNQATLVATSVTGQSNVDPLPGNDIFTEGATRLAGRNFSKIYTRLPGLNPFGLDYAPCDPNVTGDCWINQVAPNQVLAARVIANNTGTEPFAAGYVCDRIDNTRLSFFDTTGPAYSGGGATRDGGTGIQYSFGSGLLTHLPGLTFELGVGGVGHTGDTWTTFNTVSNEYVAPSLSGATQADSSCGSGDAIWYPSVAALLADGKTLQQVSRVRFSYASMSPGVRIAFYIPLQARATYAYSGTDNAP
ncbi:MAG: hypothetical protein K1X39_11635, partial [Thermoflexales bacterium]|nr:hypothetical protein [Thermoflexales bacterium]